MSLPCTSPSRQSQTSSYVKELRSWVFAIVKFY